MHPIYSCQWKQDNEGRIVEKRETVDGDRHLDVCL